MVRGICLATVLLSSPVPAPASEASARRGLLFVETNCASCHAIRLTDASPVAAAPPFRDLHKRYPVSDLAEAFAEGIVTGHPTMPQFELDGAGIGDLTDYLLTLER